MKDLKVQITEDFEPTYLPKMGWIGGCTAGDFNLSILSDTGFMGVTYYYQRYYEGELDNYEVIEGWYKDDGLGDVEPLSQEELNHKYSLGQGFWIAGHGMSLASSGQVPENEVEFICNLENYTACGNGTPCDLNLGHLTVTTTEDYEPTYLPKMGWIGGCTAGDFVVSFLDDTGTMVENYYYQRYYEGDQDDYEVISGWYRDDGMGDVEPIPAADLEKIKIPAGLGLWIVGHGMTLNVPAPEL